MGKRRHEESTVVGLESGANDENKTIIPKRRRLSEDDGTANGTLKKEKPSKSKRESRNDSKKPPEPQEALGGAVQAPVQDGETSELTDAEKAAAKQTRKAEKKRAKESLKQAKRKLKKLGVQDQTLLSGTAPEHRLSEELEKAEPNGNTNGNLTGVDVAAGGSYTESAELSALPQPEIDSFLSSSFITITDPSGSKALRPIMSFAQLPHDAHPQPSPFAGFKNPTPIQSAAWPFLLAGRDVIGVAETGSGKTLAFGVPCIRHISSVSEKKRRNKDNKKGGAARAVIVSPTRELAVQIYEQMVLLAKSAGLEAVCVYGGVPKDSQRQALKTAQIVIATPGRLNDLIEEGAARLANVDYLVLDEADRMLDKGFEDAIRKIVSSTSSTNRSSRRQTLMFTATWPPSVRELAATFMQNPVKIAIGDNPTGELRANARIVQKVEVVDPRGKETRLLQLLKQHQSGKSRNDRILVFCLYKKEATRVEGFLRSKGLRCAGIHGDLSQEKRTASLESFKTGDTPLLVATDVAARGLDIPAVKVVINVTFPLTVEDYVHRIGRQVLPSPNLLDRSSAEANLFTVPAGQVQKG